MAEMSGYRETGPAPGELAHPALALVNSRRNSPNGPLDELASPVSLRAWLREHGFGGVGRCGFDDAAALRELRGAVREVLLARIEERTPDQSAVGVVNQAAAAAPSAPGLEWAAGGPVQVRQRAGARGIALARALLAADAIELLVGEDHADLRACAAPGCIRLLLRDHPRRQWCSIRCGDRVRASRYYHRHRSPAGEATSSPRTSAARW